MSTQTGNDCSGCGRGQRGETGSAGGSDRREKRTGLSHHHQQRPAVAGAQGQSPAGLRPAGTAAREAWEEAGLVGRVAEPPLGTYQFVKLGCLHEVVVYRMQVREAKRNWPERKKRRRRWLRPAKASERIDHAELRAIVADAGGGLVKAA